MTWLKIKCGFNINYYFKILGSLDIIFSISASHTVNKIPKRIHTKWISYLSIIYFGDVPHYNLCSTCWIELKRRLSTPFWIKQVQKLIWQYKKVHSMHTYNTKSISYFKHEPRLAEINVISLVRLRLKHKL